MKTYEHLWYLAQFFWERNIFRQKLLERKSKHPFYAQCFFFSGNNALYEATCKNMAEPDSLQMTI